MTKKGITASELKYIAILAMFADHIAWAFIPTDTILSQIIHFFGRITAPVMCFFLTEGFHYTRNIKKYFGRLAAFAVVSHFAYALFSTGSFFGKALESVITTLFLSLAAIWVLNYNKIKPCFKIPIILMLIILSEHCDWGYNLIFFTLAFELGRGSRKDQILAYASCAFILNILPLFSLLRAGFDLFFVQIFNLGVLLPIPLLMLYNGQKGGGKATKWVFYIFYPAHLIVIGLIDYIYG